MSAKGSKTPRLGVRQIAMLREIVRTNGGGVHYFCGGEDERVMRSLVRRGLIQGKAGWQTRAVHTRAGLELVRELDRREAEQSAPESGGGDA